MHLVDKMQPRPSLLKRPPIQEPSRAPKGTKNGTGRHLAAALLFPLCVASVHADDEAAADTTASHLQLSGFGTVGLSHAHSNRDWLFARELTQVGASGNTSARVDSRLGLQMNWAPAERWETVLQLVLRQRAKNAGVDEAVEWAFVGYQISPDLQLRLGRTSPDIFLQADVRNVGYALPWARPNIEFYGWMPINSLDGADLSYIWRTEHADWTAKVQLGNGMNTIQALRADDSLRIHNRNTTVFTLSREAGPWLIKASYARADIHVRPNANLRQLQQRLQQIAALPVPTVAEQAQTLSDDLYPQGLTQYASLGLQYQSGIWFGSAEASHVDMATGLSGGWRGYASVGRRWQRLSAFLIAGLSRANREPLTAPLSWAPALAPIIGPQAAAAATGLGVAATEAANSARFEQSSLGLGLRYDFAPRTALKLQVDQVSTRANGAAAWRNGSAEPGRTQVYSATLDFIF